MGNSELQKWVDNAIKTAREDRMKRSDQLTLGIMIQKLEPIVEKQKERKDEATVFYDFGNLFPTEIDSWRGSYAELALNYTESGESPMKVSAFLSLLKESVGKTFQGYKGGDFTMSNDTPVWVANYGRSGNTAVIDIVDDGYQVIVMTAYRPY